MQCMQAILTIKWKDEDKDEENSKNKSIDQNDDDSKFRKMKMVQGQVIHQGRRPDAFHRGSAGCHRPPGTDDFQRWQSVLSFFLFFRGDTCEVQLRKAKRSRKTWRDGPRLSQKYSQECKKHSRAIAFEGSFCFSCFVHDFNFIQNLSDTYT